MTIQPLEMIFKPIIINKWNNWTLFLKDTFFPLQMAQTLHRIVLLFLRPEILT